MEENIIPKDTRYVPLTQQPYCCVPTCIQMIMVRHEIPLQATEVMAYHLQAVVPPEKKQLFWNVSSAEERPPAGYGTCVSGDQTLNHMFDMLNIPLRAHLSLIDDFADEGELLSYLDNRVENKWDTLVCFDHSVLFDTEKPHGHVCVLDTVDRENGKVRFIDPEANVPKWRTVEVGRLFDAMQKHGKDNMAGCWEIGKIQDFT